MSERCAYCLHLKTRHKFAKKGEKYASFKMYAKTMPRDEMVEILNLKGFCEEPLCDCLQYLPGGLESDYQTRLTEDANRLQNTQFTIATDFDTMQRAGKMLRRDNTPMPKKKRSSRRATQSIQRLLP